jgi:hypothetical protein
VAAADSPAAAAVGVEGDSPVRVRIALVVLLLCCAAATSSFAGSAASPKTGVSPTVETFASTEEAVAALADALRAGKQEALGNVFGPGSGKLLGSGDKYADAAERQRFLTAFDEQHKLVAEGPGRVVLQLGKDDWPFPIPLVQQADGRWRFDTPAGADELINRRIGRDEIAAIRIALAYVDAQKAYFALTGQEGHAEYAQRLASSSGKHDGLYWPAAEGEPDSPLEPLMAQAQQEGYPGERISGKPVPYQGYLFRILTGQGTSVPEGARNYIVGSRMTGGFALIAWPASFGASGIMTFIVNQDGIVFQKDLGPKTATLAASIKLFDPDLSWARVDVVD